MPLTQEVVRTEKSKLSGIATSATANDTDANLKARANHTGTQLAATISDFNAAALFAAPSETTTTEGSLINSAASKSTPIDADFIGLMDSAASNILKKLSWANIKATLKTYFDTIYQATGVYLTAANIVQVITNGNTTTAPSEDAVFDALTTRGQVNSAEFSQIVVSGTAYYITGSAINVPTNLQVGSSFSWDMTLTKTNAGTGTFQFRIYRGTNGTTGDTADVTQTIGTQTAVVDTLDVTITVYVNNAGATGGYFWTIAPTNKAATATGFGVTTGTTGVFSGTVASVAMNTANLKFGIAFIATTGTPTIRVAQIRKFS